MAQALIANEHVRSRIITIFGNQVAVNTVTHVVASVGAPPATDQDLCNTLDAAIAAAMKALMTNGATYRGVLTQIFYPPPVEVAVSTVANSGLGTGGTTPMPKQVTGMLSLQTAKAGRAYRGRLYIPFPDQSINDTDDTPNATYVTRLDTLYTAILSVGSFVVAGRSATVIPVIYHRALHLGDNITSHVSRKLWGTQRRRGNYGRPNTSPI